MHNHVKNTTNKKKNNLQKSSTTDFNIDINNKKYVLRASAY